MYLSLDRNLVSGDEVVRSSSFPTCRDGGGFGGGVIGDDFGGIRVGKRKKKATAANGNGDR